MGVGALGLAPLLWSGCGSEHGRSVRVFDAEVVGDAQTATRIALSTQACDLDLRTRQRETADAVTVTITGTGKESGRLCSKTVTIRLTTPLGGRRLVDGSTGTTVAVRSLPSP
jgi:hypothetical protein